MSPPTDTIKGAAILFSEMTPPVGGEDAFNAWYDGHHTPSHVQGVPGFLSAMRYRSPAGPHYLAIYELESVAALDCDEYRSRKLAPDAETAAMLRAVSGFTRYVCAEAFCAARKSGSVAALDASVLACVFYAVPLEHRGSFEDWYDNEHAQLLLSDPDWLMVRRFDIVEWDPEPYTHLMLHYLASDTGSSAEPLARVRSALARAALATETWFQPLIVSYYRRNGRFYKSG